MEIVIVVLITVAVAECIMVHKCFEELERHERMMHNDDT